MITYTRDDILWADIFFDDLSTEAQTELLNFLGDNGNYDVFPIASINVSQEGEDDEQSNYYRNSSNSQSESESI